MTIVDAAKRSSWIRRKRWASWIHVDADRSLDRGARSLTWADIMADDWVPNESFEEPSDEDDSSKRFSLIELE